MRGPLQLLDKFYLLVGELLSLHIVLANGGAILVLLGVVLVAAVCLDPLLYAAVLLLDLPYQLVIDTVFLGDLILHMANLLGEILRPVDPFV